MSASPVFSDPASEAPPERPKFERKRPGLADIVTFFRLRLTARRSAEHVYRTCLDLDPLKHGPNFARWRNRARPLIAASRGETERAREHSLARARRGGRRGACASCKPRSSRDLPAALTLETGGADGPERNQPGHPAFSGIPFTGGLPPMSKRLENLNNIVGILNAGAKFYRNAARQVSTPELEQNIPRARRAARGSRARHLPNDRRCRWRTCRKPPPSNRCARQPHRSGPRSNEPSRTLVRFARAA